ncbi:hypothetical protein Ciccas_002630 [Cichlidogyrus casuarinus]|uniref:BRCT domain-containing protein n=1 Tax=Cichlidogyrus casuarinus TaxID=1844966 RepID=A0ABD2QGX4_9PLAT
MFQKLPLSSEEEEEEQDKSGNQLEFLIPASKTRSNAVTTSANETLAGDTSNQSLPFGSPQMTSTQKLNSTHFSRNSIDCFQLQGTERALTRSSNRLSGPPFKIAFTGFNSCDVAELKTLMETSSIPRALYQVRNEFKTGKLTHLVVPKTTWKRTINFLRALMLGASILTEDWIRQSSDNGFFLPDSEFKLPGMPNPKKLQDLFSSCGRIFIGSLQNKSEPPRSDLTSLLSLGKGKFTNKKSSAEIQIGGPPRTDVKCVKPNWVIDSIMKGSLEPFALYEC